MALPVHRPTISPDKFRLYEGARDCVTTHYQLNHALQTVEFVKEMRENHLQLTKGKMTIWEAISLLDSIVDESDPDTDQSQLYHALQTAEALRFGFPNIDWLHLVGLIHDCGKILAHPDFGNLPQWCVVGDIFPVGCAFSPSIVHYEAFNKNPDTHNPLYNTQYGIYSQGIGLSNVLFSFGHDEYMAQVCKKNGCTIPEVGLEIIRLHSFYAWHKEGAYQYLMDEKDRETLKWVKVFSSYDLYTKRDANPNPEALHSYYEGLIRKYFPEEEIAW